MKTKKLFLSMIMSVFVLTGLANAEPQKWDIDKAHSNIYFDIKHIYSETRGLFDDFSGLVLFDPENKAASSVEFQVKVDSINTNISKRDTHLISDDFFAAKQFPLMKFTSTSVKHVSDNHYLAIGDLTIKDVTKQVEVPFTFLGMRDNPVRMGAIVAGFEAEFTIDRLEYHVGSGKYYEMGVIGKDVHIVISLEVNRDK